MRITTKLIAFISAFLLCTGAVSCKKDDTLQYNNITMGNVTDGLFTSDQGNIFHVADQNPGCVGKLDTMKRAIILCDVLCKTLGGQDNEYDIRLNGMASVRVKDIQFNDTDVEGQIYKEDPVNIEQLWISGGYINMYVSFYYKSGSTAVHEINLLKRKAEEGYLFRLVHNSNGDVITDETMNEYVMAGGYFSFPVTSIITEEVADIRFEWLWYQTVGSSNNININTTGYITTTFSGFRMDGFQHTPATISLASAANLM